MNTRGCALVMLVLILAVLAWGVLSAVPDLQIALPKVTWPSFKGLPTLGPMQIGIPTSTGNLPGTVNPLQTVTGSPVSTPESVKNGRLMLLGLDGAVWSADVEAGLAAWLGLMMEVHIYSGNPWYSPDGKFVLVARRENEQDIAYLVHADGKIPELRLAPLTPEFDYGGPRDFFAFAPDGRRFFFLDASANPANLIIVTLDDLTSITWPVQASPEEVTYASFWGSSDQLILKSYDPNLQAHYLEVFQVGSVLSAPRRLFVREGYQIVQFVVSPNAAQLAVVTRRFGENQPDELQVFDLTTGALTGIETSGLARIVLTSPAWSPDSRYLLFNRWLNQAGELVYTYDSFDVEKKATTPLFDKVNASEIGQPLSRVFSFAPDGLGAAIRLYDDIPGNISSLLVLMDGSYHREIARAALENGVPVGSYVAGFTPDWTQSVIMEPQPGGKLGNLYAAALDGSHKELLDDKVPYEFFELGPMISPDGKWVAYLRIDETSGQAALNVIRFDGSGRRAVFSGATALSAGQAPAGLPLLWLPVSGRR